jgi:hypothetical protein
MTIGQYSPKSRGGIAYADLTRELLARVAREAQTGFEAQMGAAAPEGVIDG